MFLNCRTPGGRGVSPRTLHRAGGKDLFIVESELLAAILSQLQDFGSVLIVGVGLIVGLLVGRVSAFWEGGRYD